MSLTRRILDGLRGWFRSSPPARSTARRVVTNLTRQTVVATSVEVADSGPARNKGLLGRTGLGAGEGLWIVPCESVHTIGMQFPIDLVYLDRNLRIRKLQHAVPAWRFSACLSAHSIIELGAGAIKASQTEVGDKVAFSDAGDGSAASQPNPD